MAIRFLELARQACAPVLGAEIHHGDHRAVLLVTSDDGYANLCRLISGMHYDAHFNFVSAVATHQDAADAALTQHVC
jgi:error-prone DNA polymerase